MARQSSIYTRLFVLLFLLLCLAGYTKSFEDGTQDLPQSSPNATKPVGLEASATKAASTAASSSSSGSISDADAAVKKAHEALAVMNKGRLAYPQFNTYEFAAESTSNRVKAAPALDYKSGPPAQASKIHISLNSPMNKTSASAKSFQYTIPPDLAEAARLVAEASPLPLPGDYGVDIAKVVQQYRVYKANDTNQPQQKYLMNNALRPYLAAQPAVPTDMKVQSSVDFWLTTIEQRGSSPFAPAGYKVWRNVKDYGAKGDGISDDTAAINKAISDGGRCGVGCGSSTIYPAFVYFPPGTYLVSSPIIQYYNTEFYGNPFDYPTILAASSFVGLGVITSDVYTGDREEWYLNTNNFLRSIRNFKMDITRTNPDAYVCAIHWQVAQGTSLENIVFYMMQDGKTTQQGIYMENGSGGFLTNLTFIGGNFGAYFGNQQFTTSQLSFINSKTALQIHWDWAWTMQDLLIHNCTNGIVIVGGAGGPGSTGQSVGSLIVLDSIIAKTKTGIVTSLFAENSTSFLLQNSVFIAVETAIQDQFKGQTLMPGGKLVRVDSWGFGRVSTTSTNSTFINGQNIQVMNRSISLTMSDGVYAHNFFQRRRPSYTNIGMSQIIDVKAWGAAGDGKTDDSAVLNSILDRAANMSSIVFFPFGVYVIKDTLRVPVGSRIMGQTWSQILATGSKFQDEKNPQVAVRVGNTGDVGIIEIQSMMFTVSGPTAGAILLEWNVHESSQGSAGMWDSHFRVGGAIGSELQAKDCPRLTGTVNPKCRAASLVLHLTPQSSAYLENIWVWTADHDMDVNSQDQIDVYAGRGVLVESQGPTWMYGTASEHHVLYQYQISAAKDLYMSMIQTESPYFQPVPHAPSPFPVGLFPNDPTFSNCDRNSKACAVSWALRIIDSSSIYCMGAGLYSWFSDYTQDCLKSENCQQRGVEIAQSTDTWIYNLVTKGMVEMVSPVNEDPTLSANNINGFMSSILAWIRQANHTIGERKFPGFQLYEPDWLDGVSNTCKTALSQKIFCDPYLQLYYRSPAMARYIDNQTLADSVCDKGCGESLKSWFDNVSTNCANQTIGNSVPTRLGGYIYAGYNLTCLKDPKTHKYCADVVMQFEPVDNPGSMIIAEQCSYCYTTMLQMRQASPYAAYTEKDQRDLEFVNTACLLLKGPTDLHPSLWISDPAPPPMCVSNVTHITQKGDTCDSLALKYKVASAAIQIGNPTLVNNCTALVPGRKLCMPLSCDTQYTVKDGDTCLSIEWANRPMVAFGSVRKYNSWLNSECTNLQSTRPIHGSVICLSPQAGTHNSTGTVPTADGNGGGFSSSEYSEVIISVPANARVANGTTSLCGKWYTAAEGDSCAAICVKEGISSNLFVAVNPSLKSNCDGSLVKGTTYCVSPDLYWDDPDFWK